MNEEIIQRMKDVAAVVKDISINSADYLQISGGSPRRHEIRALIELVRLTEQLQIETVLVTATRPRPEPPPPPPAPPSIWARISGSK